MLPERSPIARAKTTARELLRRTGLRQPKPSYQQLRSKTGGFMQRWALIRNQLSDDDRSVLDIGCNEGRLTRLAAESGRLAIGVEPQLDLVIRGRNQRPFQEGLGLINMKVTDASVETLPTVDVVFLLSVQHQFVSMLGEDAAWALTGKIASHARHQFFFEPASIRSKYKGKVLAFEDNDAESILKYNTERLTSVLPGWQVKSLGQTPNLGDVEHFRLMLVAQRPES
ncbi:MAG: class I SAM-dependent methyltransferase [Deltaproteobacteria bacterium]|nr:class I SAM-dependent methyltransferase [Deltaproteobacteria bacterium]